MNPEPDQDNSFKSFLKIAVPIFAFILLFYCAAVINEKHDPPPKVNQADTSIRQSVVHEDSVKVANGKVPRSTFESDYSAETWYAEFKANRVAFDRKYKDKLIDVYGTIARINNEMGCSEIEINGDDGAFDKLSFSNCPAGSDHWSDEVVNVTVGQQVHIRGYYGGSYLSDGYSFVVYKCHII